MHNDKLKRNRLNLLDIFRGIALIAMAIYHFGWNLSHFGYLAPYAATEGSFVNLARFTAASFIGICGFSLYLAHKDYINWQNFFKRLSIIIFFATLISLGSYIFMPENFVYFGILHEIALTSLVLLLFLRTPLIVNGVFIVFILFAKYYFTADFFNQNIFLWLGLSTIPRPSVDYVPFFPWFAAGLSGLTLARFLDKIQKLSALKGDFKPIWLQSSLEWLGRHSLAFYLLHQPILFLLVFLATYIITPTQNVLQAPMQDPLLQSCQIECQKEAYTSSCQSFCNCVVDSLVEDRLYDPFYIGDIDATHPKIQNTLMACYSQLRK